MSFDNDDVGLDRVHKFALRVTSADAAKIFKAALKRDLHPDKLVTALFRVILRDNLIDAVLDDANDPDAPRDRRIAQ